jgi:type I restriction enzyme S subunit
VADTDFCKEGDLVIADASEDYNDIGKAIEIISVKPKSLVAGLHTYIARPKIEVSLGFSGYLFQSSNLRTQIKKIAQGISVLGISKTNLEKVVIPYPSPEEQQKIANFLSTLDKKLEAVQKQIDQTETFKKGLLQKMFV